MRALIIGGGGYLGSHLVNCLIESGADVSVTYRGAGPNNPRLRSVVSGFDLCAGSLTSLDFNIDVVYILAGLTGVSSSYKEAEKFVQTNVIGITRILNHVCSLSRPPRVVLPSTRLVYAGSCRLLDEAAPSESKSVYAASKLAAEGCLRAYSAKFKIPHSILRIGVPYGDSLNGGYSYGTVGLFTNQIMRSGVVRVFGDGAFRRTFTHVDDICTALQVCGDRKAPATGTYNVPGEGMSIRDVAEAISSRLGGRVEYVPWPSDELAVESGSTEFDSRLFVKTFGFDHKISFDEWISASLQSDGKLYFRS